MAAVVCVDAPSVVYTRTSNAQKTFATMDSFGGLDVIAFVARSRNKQKERREHCHNDNFMVRVAVGMVYLCFWSTGRCVDAGLDWIANNEVH